MDMLGCIGLKDWTEWNAALDRLVVKYADAVQFRDRTFVVGTPEAWPTVVARWWSVACELGAAAVILREVAQNHHDAQRRLWLGQTPTWQDDEEGWAARNWIDALLEFAEWEMVEPKALRTALEKAKPEHFPALFRFPEAVSLDTYNELIEEANFFPRLAPKAFPRFAEGPDAR